MRALPYIISIVLVVAGILLLCAPAHQEVGSVAPAGTTVGQDQGESAALVKIARTGVDSRRN